MALRYWECKKCSHKEPFFDHEDKKCPKCDGIKLKKLIGIPLQAKNVVTEDKLHNVQVEVGINEDARKRSTKHVNDTIDELILEHGEAIAKEQGWLISEDNGKTWRKRNDWDTKTINATNSGTKRSKKK